MKRVFLIVLDSFGIGECPDAIRFHDEGSDTFRTVSGCPDIHIPHLCRLGLANIDGPASWTYPAARSDSENYSDIHKVRKVYRPTGAFARMTERSGAKDTTVGHWEIAGLSSPKPMPVFPDGFDEELLGQIREATGRDILCNKPYSGTQVIRDYGREHEATGALIVYTSADSVLQIAAHEEVIPVEELYRICETVRKLCVGRYAVGRVIARPFVGTWPDYTRTSRRHDFSVAPPQDTVLDKLKAAGKDVLSVGKIIDIFAQKGITDFVRTSGNTEGMQRTMELFDRDFDGLAFINLVDYDMLYGHRNNIAGYAAALNEFDDWLPKAIACMRDEDVLMITADHGCDPGTQSTDHSREYTPWLIYGKCIAPGVNLGTRPTFADIAATIEDYLIGKVDVEGESLLPVLTKISLTCLARKALSMRERSYSPYSGFSVGAALLGRDGSITGGCNIENASYGVSNCAERTALFSAVAGGLREFKAIALAGGKAGLPPTDYCMPCGVCRQALLEFAKPEEFYVISVKSEEDYQVHTLAELMPAGFGKESL